MRLAVLVVVVCITACGGAPPPAPPARILPTPTPDRIDAVLFLVGDAGDHPLEESPLVHRLRADVESWTSRLARDSAVTVLFLGDNVYPEGVRPRGDPGFEADSARLYAQIWTVSGPEARRYATRGLFLAGNHDWGNARAPEGLERLRNEEAELEAHAHAGARVRLIPAAGDPGPQVIDLGAHVRVLGLDTDWWLQREDTVGHGAFGARVADATRGAGARQVIVASHHPNISAGPHGAASWTGVDPMWLLRRAGAVVQDVNAAPYRAMVATLERALAAGRRPLVWAAGHDHSLQVLNGARSDQPTWTLVSGAGSKVSGVGSSEALVWASPEPGYMYLLVDRMGGVTLFVVSAPEQHLHCAPDPATRAECIDRGVAAFRPMYSRRLH